MDDKTRLKLHKKFHLWYQDDVLTLKVPITEYLSEHEQTLFYTYVRDQILPQLDKLLHNVLVLSAVPAKHEE